MKIDFTAEDRKKIEEGIRGKYAKVAVSAEGLLGYPAGRSWIEVLKYTGYSQISARNCLGFSDSYWSGGSPFSSGEIRARTWAY